MCLWYENVPSTAALYCIEYIGVKDDQTEENTFKILQHSDININNN